MRTWHQMEKYWNLQSATLLVWKHQMASVKQKWKYFSHICTWHVRMNVILVLLGLRWHVPFTKWIKNRMYVSPTNNTATVTERTKTNVQMYRKYFVGENLNSQKYIFQTDRTVFRETLWSGFYCLYLLNMIQFKGFLCIVLHDESYN